MPRPVTLFTGQWADLPLAKLLPLVKQMGYDGVELACWGDHFDVEQGRLVPALRARKLGAAAATTACRATPCRTTSWARRSAT